MRHKRMLIIICNLILLISALLIPGVIASEAPLCTRGPIEIDSGLISGTCSNISDSISVYKGIPYAAPPVGDRRWRPPAPVKHWKGIRPATSYGPAAPQYPSSFGGVNKNTWQMEDCLYLNVWTPSSSGNEKLPVMVWIHGGGFRIGAGSVSGYNGTRLAEKGVVLVTLNYRLNFFGAFAHPLLTKESEHNASGNYGLMDQIAALKWVQQNIAGFGGDPGRVAIFGESAGSRSVAVLMVSPLTKGLFHRGICQSGAVRGVSQSREEREKECMKVADTLKARSLEELRALSWEDLAETGYFNSNPIVDGWVIPEDPGNLYAAGKQHNVPLITGVNRDEGTLGLLNSRIDTVIKYKQYIRDRYKENAGKILEIYSVKTDSHVKEALNRLSTDSRMALQARRQARWMEDMGVKSYFYYFTRVPPTRGGKLLKAHHGAEIAYVFGNIGPAWGKAEDMDRVLSGSMMTYWTQFAASGDPNEKGLPKWPVYEAKSDRYMELGNEIKAGKNLRKKELDILEKFIK